MNTLHKTIDTIATNIITKNMQFKHPPNKPRLKRRIMKNKDDCKDENENSENSENNEDMGVDDLGHSDYFFEGDRVQWLDLNNERGIRKRA